MLDLLAKHLRPAMFPVLIDGEARPRECRIGKRTQWYGGDAGPALNDIGDGRPTVGTEPVSDLMATVGGPDPGRCSARNRDLRVRPARLRGKDTPCAPLAVEAVTDGYTDGLADAFGLKLTATAPCYSGHHCTEISATVTPRPQPPEQESGRNRRSK